MKLSRYPCYSYENGRSEKSDTQSEERQNHQQLQLHHNPNQQPNNGFSRNGSDAADSNSYFRTRKLSVRGLSARLSEEEFKNYFERFGGITDVVMMHDSSTNRPRGFEFVTSDSEESVENVMPKSFHELNARLVELKRAVPKEGNNDGYNNHNTTSIFVRQFPYNGFQAVSVSFE